MNKLVRYISVYIKSPSVRLYVASLFSIVFNSCYVVFNLVLGILYGDAWFITIAAYYTVIAFLRYLLMDGDADDASHTAGVLMLILGVPMTGMIIYTVIVGKKYTYSAIVSIAFAAYAAFSIFRAISGMISFKKNKNSARRALYSVRLSAALMSLFNFQTALLSTSSFNGSVVTVLNFMTGASVSISVFAMAAKISKYKITTEEKGSSE